MNLDNALLLVLEDLDFTSEELEVCKKIFLGITELTYLRKKTKLNKKDQTLLINTVKNMLGIVKTITS